MVRLLLLFSALSLPVSAFLPLSAPANGTASTLDELLGRIERKYDAIETFHATFVQSSVIRALDKVERATGEVWFKKPYKMRWNYYTPFRDQIVSDGDNFWYYNHQERQVVLSSLGDVLKRRTTTTLLQGLQRARERFTYRFPSRGSRDKDGNWLIELEPRDREGDGDEVNRFVIAAAPSDWVVRKIYLYDPFGNETVIEFDAIEINGKVRDSTFKFEPPRGVEIIRAPSTDERKR